MPQHMKLTVSRMILTKNLNYKSKSAVKHPQTPCSSIADSWSQLRKAVARYGKHPVSITPAQYHSTKYVFGLDMEALPQVGYTGLSTKNGEMITVKVKAVNPTATMTGQMPTSLFMVLCTDNIIELRDSGVSVLD